MPRDRSYQHLPKMLERLGLESHSLIINRLRFKWDVGKAMIAQNIPPFNIVELDMILIEEKKYTTTFYEYIMDNLDGELFEHFLEVFPGFSHYTAIDENEDY